MGNAARMEEIRNAYLRNLKGKELLDDQAYIKIYGTDIGICGLDCLARDSE
jgi:hypothetical protein